MPFHVYGWLLIVCFSSVVVQATVSTPFKPWEYEKNTASCKAIRRKPSQEEVDIQLKYVNINPDAAQTIIMVHGWPSLWSTWSNQIQEFQEEYHLVVPDLRGFGESTHPGDTRSSGTLVDMVNDLVCVLQDANSSSAICMGHDWGSSICYEAARLRPDLFTAVVGVVVPYVPAVGHYIPIKHLTSTFPTLTYQLFFDSMPEVAVAELDKDIRRTIRGTLRTVASPPPAAFLKSRDTFIGAWDDTKEIPPVPFFSPEEENYFVEQYSINGFNHTLQFYSDENRQLGWKFANAQGNQTITQPVLAVYPTEVIPSVKRSSSSSIDILAQDPVADWVIAAKMLNSAEYLPNLTTEVLPGAHWVHLEHPKKFNEVVRRWLRVISDEDHLKKSVEEL